MFDFHIPATTTKSMLSNIEKQDTLELLSLLFKGSSIIDYYNLCGALCAPLRLRTLSYESL